MERLTQRIKTGEVLMASEYEEKYTTEEWICVLQDRLAAYEDTGLTPDQVVNAKTIIKSAFADDTSKAERIRKLVSADDEGRVVVLPRKVYETDEVRVYEHAVRGIIYRTADGPDFDKSTIGKGIFLTSEEADRAKEGRKDG